MSLTANNLGLAAAGCLRAWLCSALFVAAHFLGLGQLCPVLFCLWQLTVELAAV